MSDGGSRLKQLCTADNIVQLLLQALSQAIIWSWYAATKGGRTDAVWFLVGVVVLGTAFALGAFAAWEMKTAYSASFGFYVVLFVLWGACVVIGALRIDNDDLVASNAIVVITDKNLYRLLMSFALLVLCALPNAANKYVNNKKVAKEQKLPLARQYALVMVWCVLDVYSLYLVHELTTIVYQTNSTFAARWQQSTQVPANSTMLCDQEDAEMKTYGLLYQNQVSTSEALRFTCAFELHEAIRLNVLCAVVAWTIYRMSTHGRSALRLLVTGMVFLAVTTTVDDLRSYWVLRLEQAAFLSAAAVLDAGSKWDKAKRRKEKEARRQEEASRSGMQGGTSNDGSSAKSAQTSANSNQLRSPSAHQSETSPFLMPRPGSRSGMRLDF